MIDSGGDQIDMIGGGFQYDILKNSQNKKKRSIISTPFPPLPSPR